MAKYKVTLDGRTFELIGDHMPTEEEARQATGLSKQTDEITADSTVGEVASAAFGNIGSDLKELGAGAVSMLTPSGAVKTMEGMIDLGSAGMSKLVDTLGLDKYADPKKMEKYRNYRGIIADEFSELATEGGIKKRLAEKPITSLLELSVGGRFLTAPLKAQQYSSKLQKLGEVGNKISSAIDPTQIITKPAGMLFDKIKSKADVKQSQMADVDATLSKFTEEGFVVPPSSTAQAGTIRKTAESLLGNTKANAIKINQKIFDKNARKFVGGKDKNGNPIMDIPETTPLTKMVNFVAKKYKGTYNTIKSYKPVVLQKSKTTKGKPEEIDTGFLDASGKPIMKTVTPPPSKTKTVYSRSGTEILNDIKKIKLDYANAWRTARKKAARDGQDINYKKIEKEKARLDKAEAELDFMAKKYGDKEIIGNLQEAKQGFARAFNVEGSVKKGNLDAVDFYKKNTRNKAPVKDEGKIIMDFVEEYGDVVKPAGKSSKYDLLKDGLLQTAKYGSVGYASGGYGIPLLLGAEKAIPNLLLSKNSQRKLSSGDYMPTGSGLLNQLGNRKTVGASAFIPSLLDSTKAQYAPLLEDDNKYTTINIIGGGR